MELNQQSGAMGKYIESVALCNILWWPGISIN